MIKQTLVTLAFGAACGLASISFIHNVDSCRKLVLQDMAKHAQFAAQVSDFVESKDFLTELTKGK